MNESPLLSPNKKPTHSLLGMAIWFLGWVALYYLDAYLDLNNLAMLLVLTSALAAVCLPWRTSVGLAVLFVLLFDWSFIPPRGTFAIDFHQHALMLFVMVIVNIIIVVLMVVLRAQSDRAERHAKEADTLRQWSDLLFSATDPLAHLQKLQSWLSRLSDREVALLVLKKDLPAQDDLQQVWQLGDAGIEQRYALWYCTRNNQQLGRGTGRYEMFSDVYLPVRARGCALGAVLIKNFDVHEFSTRIHLQAICDLFGHALERFHLLQQETAARDHAQAQLVRNTLLAAISHDYRTPLATIMGSASSLIEQQEKLTPEQHQQLAQRIFDEAERLAMMTTNILQLARLDADHRIHCDWQSGEEIIANIMRRWRDSKFANRLQINCQANLPLLWCDAVLIGQLLENLIDNAFKYGPEDGIVTLSVRVNVGRCEFSVCDQGPGIDSEWRENIFEPFQRGARGGKNDNSIGAGVGLALCRAIALAHSGSLTVDCPAAGGARFTLLIPLRDSPSNLSDIPAGELKEADQSNEF